MKTMKERFVMMKRLVNLVRGLVRQSGVGELGEFNMNSNIRSEVRSPKGAGVQSLGQRPRYHGGGRFSQASDEFVLDVPAAVQGGLGDAKAFDPERALVERTSGGCQNLEVEGSSGILVGLEPRALPWAEVFRPFGAVESRPFGAVESRAFGAIESRAFGAVESRAFGAVGSRAFGAFGSRVGLLGVEPLGLLGVESSGLLGIEVVRLRGVGALVS